MRRAIAGRALTGQLDRALADGEVLEVRVGAEVLGSADRHEDTTGRTARRVRLIRRYLPPA